MGGGSAPPRSPEEPQSFLARLDPDTASALLALGRARAYPPRSILCFEGDAAHEVLLVRSGHVKVTGASVEGREVVLDVLGAGDILGELSAIDGGPRSASAAALGAVEVCAIPLAAFNEFVAAQPGAAVALLRSVASRLRDSSRRQVEFGSVDALGRVCGRLSEMMDRFGRPEGDAVAVSAPLSQHDVAKWAGVSREAVVKALHCLRMLDWIDTKGRTITVLDPNAVRARGSAQLHR